MKPQRIQLHWWKGYRLRAASLLLNGLDVVKVDRSTRWGNPYRVGEVFRSVRITDAQMACEYFETYLKFSKAGRIIAREAQARLRGKNVACWCDLDDWCHGDILLRIANA